MIGKRKVPTYRRRIFLYFMAIAIVPLLVLGFYSYHSAVSAVRDSIRQSNETALLQVENRTENVLDAVRQDFLMIAGRSSTKEIIDQEYDDIPYPQIRSFIDEISGGESYINYADGYSFIMVIVASITFTLLNTDSGVINQIIYSLTGNKLEFLSDPKYFRWIIVIQNIWKETGWGMIIFLAALAGVDTQLYEAAQVDGAGKLRQVWHVTLPAIKSTIIIMLIMKVGTLLNTGFEQIFLMKNSLNSSVAEVFDTYVYTLGITQGAFSYSTAVGMFKSVVATVMVLTTNWICKKCGETGLY